MRNFVIFFFGAAAGATFGAALALLLTPASGEELRGQMQGRYQQVQDGVREAAATRRAELEHQLAQMRAPRHPMDGEQSMQSMP